MQSNKLWELKIREMDFSSLMQCSRLRNSYIVTYTYIHENNGYSIYVKFHCHFVRISYIISMFIAQTVQIISSHYVYLDILCRYLYIRKLLYYFHELSACALIYRWRKKQSNHIDHGIHISGSCERCLHMLCTNGCLLQVQWSHLYICSQAVNAIYFKPLEYITQFLAIYFLH